MSVISGLDNDMIKKKKHLTIIKSNHNSQTSYHHYTLLL